MFSNSTWMSSTSGKEQTFKETCPLLLYNCLNQRDANLYRKKQKAQVRQARQRPKKKKKGKQKPA